MACIRGKADDELHSGWDVSVPSGHVGPDGVVPAWVRGRQLRPELPTVWLRYFAERFSMPVSNRDHSGRRLERDCLGGAVRIAVRRENDWTDAVTKYGTQFAWQSTAGPQVGIAVDKSDWTRPNTAHTGGMVIGMCDGSVRTTVAGIAQPTWWSACLPADGKALGADW